jgi:hypothetical protein
MTPELSKALNELAVLVVTGLTSVVIPWAFKIAREYAMAKISHVQNKEARAALEFALDRLDATAKTVVDEINQGLRPSAGEKLDPELAKKLLSKAYARLCNRLPSDVKATLDEAYKDKLQSVMVGKIESKVAGAKL